MIRRGTLAVLLAGAALGLVCAQPQPPDPSKPRLVRLAPQAAKAPVGALAYSLLPNPLDQVEGNAALLWTRAALAARSARHKWADKQWDWVSTDRTPLDRLPIKEVKEVLDKHAAALHQCDQAALRTRCDWGHLPLTIQNLQSPDYLPLAEIQSMRELAYLINLRGRLALAEGKFEEARRSIVTGLVLARHVSEGNMVIQDLVGIAIASIMFGLIEEWVQIPGSPNLYWPLTELPRPLIAIRRSIRHEMNTIYRSFPQLRRFKQKKLSGEESRALVDKFNEETRGLVELIVRSLPISEGGKPMIPEERKKALKQIVKENYPMARKALLAAGRTAREVDAMSQLHVVALHYLEDYDRIRDEIGKWMSVPPWQGYAPLMRAEKDYQARAKKEGNILISMLLPALMKVYQAEMRMERWFAGMRGAEALRLYAAANNGQAPAKWSDLGVPGPTDPFTGKGLDAWYKVEAGRAVLDMPPPPGMPGMLGRHFVWTIKGR